MSLWFKIDLSFILFFIDGRRSRFYDSSTMTLTAPNVSKTLQWLTALPRHRFIMLLLPAMACLRFGLFALVFLVLKYPVHGDVARYYYPEALAVLHGLLPGHDFHVSYAPLFSYLAALPVCCWHSPMSIIIFTMLLELCTLPCWIMLAEQAFGKTVSYRAALLYVFNPLALCYSALFGSSQLWLALLLALALLARQKKKDFVSGVALGAALVMIKALAVLFVPALVATAAKKRRWMLGFLLPVILVVGACLARHIDVLGPFTIESSRYTSGNLPYLCSIAGIDISTRWVHLLSYLALAVALGVLFFRAYQRRLFAAQHGAIYLISLTLLLFMLISSKSFTTYLLLAWYPLCICLCAAHTSRWMPWWFSLWSLLALCEPGIWIRWMNKADFRLFTSHAIGAGASRPAMLIFLAVEVLLLAGYIYGIRMIWRRSESGSDLLAQ